MSQEFKYLFTPIAIRKKVAKNRAVSTSHLTGFTIFGGPQAIAPLVVDRAVQSLD